MRNGHRIAEEEDLSPHAICGKMLRDSVVSEAYGPRQLRMGKVMYFTPIRNAADDGKPRIEELQHIS